MGEYAEMMLDGTCCATCGEYLYDGGGDGIPRFCSVQCRPVDHRQPVKSNANAKKAARINRERKAIADRGKAFACPVCSRRFRHAISVEQHVRDSHK